MMLMMCVWVCACLSVCLCKSESQLFSKTHDYDGSNDVEGDEVNVCAFIFSIFLTHHTHMYIITYHTHTLSSSPPPPSQLLKKITRPVLLQLLHRQESLLLTIDSLSSTVEGTSNTSDPTIHTCVCTHTHTQQSKAPTNYHGNVYIDITRYTLNVEHKVHCAQSLHNLKL